MAKKKAKKKRVRSTEWAVGQSIVSPKKKISKERPVLVIKKDDFQNALDILEHAIGEPLAPPVKQSKKRKK
jgi:hypothetical protein